LPGGHRLRRRARPSPPWSRWPRSAIRTPSQRASPLSLAPLALDRFRGCALLLHGTGDPVIPWTESLRLYRAFAPGHARLHLIEGLNHVDAGGLGAGGRLAALEAARELLALRDGGNPCGAEPRRPS
jgi:fermentation-respiration switch protein FrsA (DUF1100 family)